MRYIILLIIVISLGIIGITTLIEVAHSGTIHSVYKEDASFNFLLNRSSSFYHYYSFSDKAPYLSVRKLGHFLAYGFLACMLFFLLPYSRLWQRALSAIFASSFIGLIDEVHQYFLINRSGRVLDVYINAVGSLVLVVILVFLYQLLLLILCLKTTLFSKLFNRTNL